MNYKDAADIMHNEMMCQEDPTFVEAYETAIEALKKAQRAKYREFIGQKFGNTQLKGFDYIARACEIYETQGKITGAYDTIAEEFNTSYGRVERNIRHYIERIKKDGTHEALAVKLNGFGNSEVIAAIIFTVEHLKAVTKEG